MLYFLFCLLYLVYNENEHDMQRNADPDNHNEDTANNETSNQQSLKESQEQQDDSNDLNEATRELNKTTASGKTRQKIKARVKIIGTSMRRILVNQMQILSAIFPSIKWSPELPAGLVQLIRLVTSVFSVDFSAFFASPECGAQSTPRQTWAVRVFIPIALGLCFVLWGAIASCWHKIRNPKYRNHTLLIVLRIAIRLLLLGLF